jgi:ComF family protein
VDYLLQRMKFNHKLHLAAFFGQVLADHIATRIDRRPDVIIPVPLHAARLQQRGYNQSLELARPIAARIGVPLDYRNVVRTRATAAQSELPAAERRKNIRGAFAVTAPLPGRVALVDDVMTTGSTLWELAKTLRAHGAEDIAVWVCARAI